VKAAFVDTSWVTAITLSQPGHERLARILDGFDRAFAAGLLEAELWSVCRREGVEPDADVVSGLAFVLPERSLLPEVEQVLKAGYLRGADLWHLANALYLSREPRELAFLTVDRRQGEIAAALGFRAPKVARLG
jgi:hypothetical protein